MDSFSLSTSNINGPPAIVTTEPSSTEDEDNSSQSTTMASSAASRADNFSRFNIQAPSTYSYPDASIGSSDSKFLAGPNGDLGLHFTATDPSATSNHDDTLKFNPTERSTTSSGDNSSQHSAVTPSATSSGDGLSQHSPMAPYPTHSGDNLPQLPLHNKLLEQVVRTPGRQPSPQPTHLGVPGASHSNNSRILHESGPGYVAPKFEGKEQQMEDGMRFLVEE